MLDDTAAAQERHERFVRRAVEGGEVWGLTDADGGSPVSQSNDDEERGVVPFWSDRAYAAQCAREEWAEYEPLAIPLAAFVATELPRIAEAGFLVGTNWNVHLVGLEVEPSELAAELEAAIDA